MNSYNKINYKLRPQKRIERAMLAELINRFSYIINKPVNYIGMGSLYYTDFVFFNKNCNLNKMISIEAMIDEKTGQLDEGKKKRFENNKPMDKIVLLPKFISEAIAENDLPFHENNIVWYDYDGYFEASYIEDLGKTIEATQKSSIIAISFNNYFPKKYYSKKHEVNTDKCYQEYVDYIIDDVEKDDFIEKHFSETVQNICEKYLQKTVKDKNDSFGTAFELKRLSKITYQDGAEMVTIVWALVDTSCDTAFDSMIDGVKILGEIDLSMQNLTLFEKLQLDKNSTEEVDVLSEKFGLDRITIERYFLYAKYIPEYTEVYL